MARRHPLAAGAAWRRLRGSGSSARGSLLLAMLVVMTIMSIFLAVAAGEWTYILRREREKELIFRGVQIARAVDEWQQDPSRGGPPTSLEIMTKPPRPALRRAYVDPMTARYGDDGKLVEGTGEWAYIGPQGDPSNPAASGPSGASGSASAASASAARRGTGGGLRGPQLTPIVGVTSTSEELSIGSYLDSAPETPYSDWKFRGYGVTRNMQAEGGYEVPRPPGFGGLRLPGGPPLQQLTQGVPGTQSGAGPGGRPGTGPGGRPPGR